MLRGVEICNGDGSNGGANSMRCLAMSRGIHEGGSREHRTRVACLLMSCASLLAGAAPSGESDSSPASSKSQRLEGVFRAAWDGDLNRVKAIVEKDPEAVRKVGPTGATPIFFAAEANRADIVDFLAMQGADISLRNSFGQTPLIWAAARASESPDEAAEILIKHGADPGTREQPHPKLSAGASALSIASLNGHHELVSLLLEKGAPARYGEGDDEESALHYACSGLINKRYADDPETAGNGPTIDLLVDALGDVNLRLPGKFPWMSPLEVAAQHGAVETVRHLLRSYPDIELDAKQTSGPGALHYAVYFHGTSKVPGRADEKVLERAEIIRLLREKGADLSRTNHQGQTPLDLALAVSVDRRIVDSLRKK